MKEEVKNENEVLISEFWDLINNEFSSSESRNLLATIGKVYDEIIYKKIDCEIKDVEHAECIAELAVEIFNSFCTHIIRKHSLDIIDAPYEIPKEKTCKLIKHLTRMIISKEKDMNKSLKMLFITSHATSIKNAEEYRKEISEAMGKINKANPENN